MVILNVQGYTPDTKSKQCWKIEYLRDYILRHEQHIPFIALTETWLKSHHSYAQLKIPSYELYRSDREFRIRGGVAAYVHETVEINDCQTFDNRYCEVLMIKMPKLKTMLFNVYRPPNCPECKFQGALNFIKSEIATVDDSWTKFLCGDSNFPQISWECLSIRAGKTKESNQSAKLFLDLLSNHGLEQFVESSSIGENGNILDLFCSNDHEVILDVDVQKTMLSDHNMVTISLATHFSLENIVEVNQSQETFGLQSFDMSRANFELMNSYFENVNWDEHIESSDDFVRDMKTIFVNVCHLCAPLKKKPQLKGTNKLKKCKHISALKRKKKKINSRLKFLKTVYNDSLNDEMESLQSKIVEINEQIKDTLIYLKRQEEYKAVDAIKSNPKFFYSYAKRHSKLKSKIGPLKDDKGKFIYHPKKMADALQRQFGSVFSNPDSTDKVDPSFLSNACINDIYFCVEDIIAAIDIVKANSASGGDGVAITMLKECKHTLAYPIYLLWKESFDTGHIPHDFLEQIVTPIYKGGSKFKPVNYRPISLTSHLIKIFERVLQKKLIAYLEENQLISDNQHGFRKGRSCLSELLAHYDELYTNLCGSYDSDTIYLDFSKAFDKVDHALLIKKLECYGVGGKLLKWITSFLANRTQQVVVDGCMSYIVNVISGVPQGSVLGPLLFLIFIDDITKSVHHSSIRMFADDSRLIKAISPENSQEDELKLTEDISSVVKWSKQNNMQLHESKFELLCHRVHWHAPNMNMRMLLALPFTEDLCRRSYCVNEVTSLQETESVKDLGITISNSFCFSEHISKIAKKANQTCFWILSVFSCRDPEVLLPTFKSLVLSTLEYACPLWTPTKIGEIEILETIQQRFTSKISTVKHLNYWDRLKALKLMSMQRRRERYVIMHMWKTIHHVVPNDLNIAWYYNDRRGIVARIPPMSSNVMKVASSCDSFFKVLGPKLWNTLSKEINIQDNFAAFKSLLDKHLIEIPDFPPVVGYSTANNNSLLIL